jgi:hypothetical protein
LKGRNWWNIGASRHAAFINGAKKGGSTALTHLSILWLKLSILSSQFYLHDGTQNRATRLPCNRPERRPPTKFFDRVFDNRWVKITAEWSGRRNLQFLRKKVSTRTSSMKIWHAENLKKEMGRRRLRQKRETEVESSK